MTAMRKPIISLYAVTLLILIVNGCASLPERINGCVVKGARLVLDENNEARDASGACVYEGIIGEDDLRSIGISSMVSARRKSASWRPDAIREATERAKRRMLELVTDYVLTVNYNGHFSDVKAIRRGAAAEFLPVINRGKVIDSACNRRGACAVIYHISEKDLKKHVSKFFVPGAADGAY
jgi:hypothetical protein